MLILRSHGSDRTLQSHCCRRLEQEVGQKLEVGVNVCYHSQEGQSLNPDGGGGRESVSRSAKDSAQHLCFNTTDIQTFRQTLSK